MNQSSGNNQGFSKQQKQELVEIVGEVVEQKVTPYFSAIQIDLQHLQENVTTLNDDVATIKIDVGALKSDVAILKIDVGALKEDVALIQEDVSELKDDVASIKKRQQEEQHTLDAHDLQFKKLKQRIA